MVTSKNQLKEIKKLPLKYRDTVVIVHALLEISAMTIWEYSQEKVFFYLLSHSHNVNHCVIQFRLEGHREPRNKFIFLKKAN